MFSAILNNGGGLFDADGNLQFSSNPRNVEAIEWLAGLVQDGSVNPASAGFSNSDKVASFFKGDAAFTLDSPGLYNREGAPADDIAVLPPLKGPHGDLGTIYWVNNIMMYQQTKHPKETETFMQWWSQNQLPLWTEGHTNQINIELAIAFGIAPDGKFSDGALRAIDNARPTIFRPGWMEEVFKPESVLASVRDICDGGPEKP